MAVGTPRPSWPNGRHSKITNELAEVRMGFVENYINFRYMSGMPKRKLLPSYLPH